MINRKIKRLIAKYRNITDSANIISNDDWVEAINQRQDKRTMVANGEYADFGKYGFTSGGRGGLVYYYLEFCQLSKSKALILYRTRTPRDENWGEIHSVLQDNLKVSSVVNENDFTIDGVEVHLTTVRNFEQLVTENVRK